MKFTIKNYKNLIGTTLCGGKWTCVDVLEESDRYHFIFNPNNWGNGQKTIVLSRFGKKEWQEGKKVYMYHLSQTNRFVSAGWFTKEKAIQTFSEILGG